MDTALQGKISADLRGLVALFASPPSADEIAHGWSEEAWVKWGRAFQDLLARFLAGAPLPEASIARAMDLDGIEGGVVMEQAASVSNSIRRLQASRLGA